ncbi:MAG: DegV family protein [Bacteroidota bacterium]
MKLGIVTDSTSDLPPYLAEQHGIQVVPSVLIMSGVEYLDGRGLHRDEFYARLPGLQSPPTTAAASLGEFASRYDLLLSNGCDQVLSIHAPATLTAIVNTARQAAQAYSGRITCVDSGSVSLGLGWQVIAAAEAAEMGLQAALDAAASTRQRVRVFAALDTLEYVRRSGRIPAPLAALGGLLSIKPLIELAEGEVRPVGAVRTSSQADQRLLSFLLQRGVLHRLAILHTGAEARARGFLDALMQRASQSVPREVLFVNVTPVIGTHVGPDGLGFASVSAG